MFPHHYDKQYEDDCGCYPEELVGVHPLGGGGLVEPSYRHYFELKHLKQIVNLTKDLNVLEVGSGNGRWVISIAPLVKHYTGLDSDREGMGIARRRVEHLGITNVDLQEIDIANFRGDRPYDFVYFSGIVEFLEDRQLNDFFQKLSPWLTPKTIILDRSTVNCRQSSLQRHGKGCYVYRTPQQIKELFGKYGFVREYHARSYRPLRTGRLTNGKSFESKVCRLMESTEPISYYMLLSLSFVADMIRPTQRASRGISHDYTLFSKKLNKRRERGSWSTS